MLTNTYMYSETVVNGTSLNFTFINAIIVNKCEVALSQRSFVCPWTEEHSCVGQVTRAGRRRGVRRAGGAGQGRRQLTGRGRKRPEKASQAEHNGGGAPQGEPSQSICRRYSLRSDGRCERFGALQRRMPPPRAPLAPRSPHLLCIYRAAQPAQGCRDVDFTTGVDVYLPMRCRHARNVRTHAAPAAAARVTPDCLLFVTMNIKIAPVR